MPTLTEAELTKATYSYFTLDEWKLIAQALSKELTPFTPLPKDHAIRALLIKLPSAVL